MPKVDYSQDRAFAADRWPLVADTIHNACFDEIIPAITAAYPAGHINAVLDDADANGIDVGEWVVWFASHDPQYRAHIHKVTNEAAYLWARMIGDTADMFDRVTDEAWLVQWARKIGNVEQVAERVTTEFGIGRFIDRLPNHRMLMRPKITSGLAVVYALHTGDRSVRDRITEPADAAVWVASFPDDRSYLADLLQVAA